QVLHMGMHVTQMMGYQELDQGLDLITTRSATTLGLSNYGLQEGKAANLLILPATSGFDALRRQVQARYSVRAGQIIAHTPPSTTTIYLDREEAVLFR